MNKYIFELLEMNSSNAGTKAKKDITEILKKEGFKEIFLDPDMNKFEKLFFAPTIIKRKIRNIESGSEFVFQYPLYSKRFSKLFLSELFKRKDIRKKVIIHDLESLRLRKNDVSFLSKEIEDINQFDAIISHNSHMTQWLIDNGIESNKITNLGIFDYLNPNNLIDAKLDSGIIFAGNLKKSEFLKKVPQNLKMRLFGLNPPQLPNSTNLIYEGVFSPEELPKYINGSFGLVWDGSSVERCDGVMGEYLKYNNPHKVSLYLSSGLPVIVWKKSAMADFVEQNSVGIAVNSLTDLEEILMSLDENEYNKMKNNVRLLSEKVRTGGFIKKALQIN
ncbi:hypothetical protein GKC32_04170 [Lactobacillus curvatus]|nr:hypothetical protein [Latilactobacillus curvatus]MSE23672.1 hypothetical protein [Latilactobacillus curvatus]